RTVQAIVQGKRRLLLTMATGTGKTETAFQICWRLWNARWNRDGRPGKPRILYLADRNILVDDPKDKTFAAFGCTSSPGRSRSYRMTARVVRSRRARTESPLRRRTP